MSKKTIELLGKEADSLLSYKAKFPKEQLHLPGPDFVDRIFSTNRQKY
jgi:fructose-bisphosphate aldolase, class I